MKRQSLLLITVALFFSAILVIFLICVPRIAELNRAITEQFDGKRWSLPAHLYARPLELYPGHIISADTLEDELQLAGYRREETVSGSGGYNRSDAKFHIVTRDFVYPTGPEYSANVVVTVENNRVVSLSETSTGGPLPFLRIDPARIGSFHPLVHEDRLVVKHDDIPELLRDTLVAVEDQSFYSHAGISILGIGRALVVNLMAGRTIQGGSTLTQQLVKNYFLNRERTLSRKIQEAVMAVILDYRYSKEEILTAYINEVYMGQDGSRAVHGFGLASNFYYRRDLQDLSVSQIATLVGMVKGPSYYDPIRKPDTSRARRDIVLQVMLEENVIDEMTFRSALSQPFTDIMVQKNGFNRFPAFLELVRRQLLIEYREDDLRESGLRILTTLDPQVQWQAEHQLTETLAEIEERSAHENIEGAVVVTGRENGEVQAVAGGRMPLQHGFNRALDARRPIGSLVKPAVYLAALSQGYTLASPLMDSKISFEHDGTTWNPENYDKQEHGRVALYAALSNSYNLATVRLGMDVGVPAVIATLNNLGYEEHIEPYPSLLLGSIAMSPMEVSQFYQTVASGGFYLPLRSIRAVLNSDAKLLTRYGLDVEQRISPQLIFLLTHALQRAMEEGTGRRFTPMSGKSYAGKTGTSNQLRDSWFAGFSGDRLGVVWLGRDDNKSVGLTGATGALTVWGRIMERIGAQGLDQMEPVGIKWDRIDRESLQRANRLNRNTTVLPFITNDAMQESSSELEEQVKSFFQSIHELFQ